MCIKFIPKDIKIPKVNGCFKRIYHDGVNALLWAAISIIWNAEKATINPTIPNKTLVFNSNWTISWDFHSKRSHYHMHMVHMLIMCRQCIYSFDPFNPYCTFLVWYSSITIECTPWISIIYIQLKSLIHTLKPLLSLLNYISSTLTFYRW